MKRPVELTISMVISAIVTFLCLVVAIAVPIIYHGTIAVLFAGLVVLVGVAFLLNWIRIVKPRRWARVYNLVLIGTASISYLVSGVSRLLFGAKILSGVFFLILSALLVVLFVRLLTNPESRQYFE